MMRARIEKLKPFLRRQHVEFYVLVVFPILAFLPYLYFHPQVVQRFDAAFIQSLAYYLFFGWSFFAIATSILYLYLGSKAIYFWAYRLYLFLYNHYDSSHLDIPASVGTMLKSIAYIFAVIFVALSFDVITTHDVLRADRDHVFQSSQYVMNLDKEVFGSYVAFELESFITNETLSRTLIRSYMGLSVVLSFVFLALLIHRKDLFRRFIMAFLVIPMLSLPIWYSVSAVSPSETYRRNVFSEQPPTTIFLKSHEHYITYQPQVVAFLERVESQKSNPDLGMYSNTAFPSMHVAWGAVAVYFGIMLWAPFALILVPWQILNMIGAVYVLQHFAIDLFLGIIIALMSVFIVHVAFTWEKRYRTPGSHDHFVSVDAVQKDVQILRTFVLDQMQRARALWRKYVVKG